MNKNHIIVSAILGALGVAFGAFGAHGLKTILSPELLETYKTGVLYHLIHSVVLLTISLNINYRLRIPFYFIFTGIILFSFSLYIYALTSITAFAMITPIGGISLIIGWIMIIVSVLKENSLSN
ncbi:MAG: DUF423 domain-containing protein [Melioribacteraceae bacterium]|nr:DUF423 domain-containing protein [Melioribacteraceae bacterium]